MRALVGQLFHEGNSFNPLPTRLEDFVVHRAPEVIDAMRGTASILGGIIAELEAAEIELIPSVAACARPGGPVEHRAYELMAGQILDAASTSAPDLVVLELHGAMTTNQTSDAEGDLLKRLRQIVGSDVTIAAGLDLHALVTERMLESADILTACKHNPHSDYLETGQTAARLALDKARGLSSPRTAVSRVPMLLAGSMGTGAGPLKSAHDLARAALAEQPSLLDVSVCNVIPLIDGPEMGQVVMAITEGEAKVGLDVVKTIAKLLWRRRSEFRDDFLTVDAALDQVVAQPGKRPFVVADYGDRVLSGAPGDSTEILTALLKCRHPIRAAVPVTDPPSVQRAKRAGEGQCVDLSVGGLYTKTTPPVTLRGRVRSLSDGRFVLRGPFLRGQQSSMGDSAVVEVGPVTLLLTSRSAMSQDPNAFESQGIAIAQQDLVVTKSGYHFELSFAGLATPLKVETTGLGLYRPGRFAVSRLPLYPEVDPGELTIEAHEVTR